MLRSIAFTVLLLETARAGKGNGKDNGNGNSNSEVNGVRNIVGELSTAMDALQESVGSLQTGSSGVQSQIDTLNIGVDAIQPELTDLQSQIDGVGSELTDLQSQIDGIAPTIPADLQKKLDGVGSELTGLQDQIDDIVPMIPADLQKKLDGVGSELTGLQSQIDDIAPTIPADLQNNLDDLDLQRKINSRSISDVRRDTAILSQEVGGIADKQRVNSKAIAGLEDKIEKLDDVTGLQIQLTGLEDKIENLEALAQSFSDLQCSLPIYDYFRKFGFTAGFQTNDSPDFIIDSFCVPDGLTLEVQASGSGYIDGDGSVCIGVWIDNVRKDSNCAKSSETPTAVSLFYRQEMEADSTVKIGLFSEDSGASLSFRPVNVGVKIYDTCYTFTNVLPDDDCTTDDFSQA